MHIGIGKWVQNLAVTAAETILLSGLFLVVDVPEMLWTTHVEGGIAKQITQIVGEDRDVLRPGETEGRDRRALSPTSAKPEKIH